MLRLGFCAGDRVFVFTALAILASGVSSTFGSPVTFRFEAEITKIDDPDGVLSSLPFQPVLGQPVSGKVTFTPISFGSSSAPDGRLEIHVGGESFAAKELPLVTQNDVYVAVGFNIQGPDDSIGMSCDQLDGCLVTETSDAGISLEHLGFGLTSHNMDVVPTGADIAMPEVWNNLPNRVLVFELSTSPELTAVTITAQIGPMRLVPEPSTFLLSVAVLAVIGGVFRRVG